MREKLGKDAGTASVLNDRPVQKSGGMAEWLKAAVLKTVVPQGTVGSNPTSSATFLHPNRPARQTSSPRPPRVAFSARAMHHIEQFFFGMDSQLAIDTLHVSFYGIDGHEQFFGDGGRTPPLNKQFQDLAFPL